MEQKKLLTHALKLVREQGDDSQVAHTLLWLSWANRELGLCKEGIQQTKEALRISEQLHDTMRQARCWGDLTTLLGLEGQLDAAEKAASHTIGLLPETGQEFLVCQSHQDLGQIYSFKGEREKAVHHLQKALGIASTFELCDELCWVHYSLADLFVDEERFNDAHDHILQAKSHAINGTHNLGRVMEMNAWIWYQQQCFEDAASEMLGAIKIFEKLGALADTVRCKELLQNIEQMTASASELPEIMPLSTSINPPSSACGISPGTSIDAPQVPENIYVPGQICHSYPMYMSGRCLSTVF